MLYVVVTVHQTISIQLAHTTRQKYNPWTKLTISVSIALITFSVISYFRNGDFNTKLAMAVLTGIASVAQWQFIISIVGEMTQILDIEVFLTK